MRPSLIVKGENQAHRMSMQMFNEPNHRVDSLHSQFKDHKNETKRMSVAQMQTANNDDLVMPLINFHKQKPVVTSSKPVYKMPAKNISREADVEFNPTVQVNRMLHM